MAARKGNQGRPVRPDIEWNFRSFPVAWAFACGAFVAVLISAFGLIQIAFVVSLFGFSFGLSHVVFHTIRRRTVDRQLEREEEAEIERRFLADRAAGDEAGTTSKRSRRRRHIERRGPAG